MDYIFRDLRADEIDVRVGQVGDGWVSLLLYKDARVDMAMLDEKFGPANWQRKHYEVKGNLFCSVGVYDQDRDQWVWKDDCGTESRTEKQKGEASDSFKRAGVNWGIGRELYTAPFIYINIPTKDKKPVDNPTFLVEEIEIQDKQIRGLVIVAKYKRKTTTVFTWGTLYKNQDVAPPVSEDVAKGTKSVLCPKCGKEIGGLNIKGKEAQPSEILEKLGMCYECWKAERVK